MKILVTGFDPFGNEKINPAIETVRLLPDKINDCEIIKLEIPTIRHKSLKIIEEKIKEYNPDVVVSIGQAGGRSDITIERIGINCDDFSIADNEGNKPIDTPIYKDGPDAYFVSLPIKAMLKGILDEGIPASISNSAGTFVCNHVLYGTRYFCERNYPNIKSGFIHVPYIPSQCINKKNVPSMALDDIVKGLTAALKAIVEDKEN